MPLTPRIGLPVPEEDQDPWFEAFLAFALGLDASIYAAREDRNIFLHGGGTFLFNLLTGALQWSATIVMTDAITGFLWQLPAGTVTLQDGQYLYVDVVRAATANRPVTAAVGFQVPNSDAATAIAVRIGNNIYFRNGRILYAGSSATVLEFETTAGGGGGSTNRITGQTTTFLGDGDFGYIAANNTWAKAQSDSTLAKALVEGANDGTVGAMLLPGNVVLNAKFTTAGGVPSPGNQVFLAAGTDDTGTGAGKLTATAPIVVGEYLSIVGVCVDNTNYGAFKTSKIIFNPRPPILL